MTLARLARKPFSLGGWAVVVVALAIVFPGLAAPAGPNVLFLLSDDQRFDTIHALGNREIRTPNLDRLVRDGMAFTRAAIMGGGQGAVCVPSRAMLMTGRTLFRATTTYTGIAIPTNAVTWPEAFRASGYETIAIGKWHNDRPSFNRSFSGGGPLFFGGMSDHRALTVHDYDPTGRYARTNERVARGFSSEVFADAAIRVLTERPATRPPFVLYVAFTAPHDPRTPPAEYARLYPPQRIRLPASFQPEHPFDNGELRVRDEALLPWPRPPDAVRRELAAYYAMITHLDHEIGRILDALNRSPFATNTLVVFAGDNGLALGHHGLLGKQSVYEHSARVPLIFAGPAIPRGRRSDALCYLLDVMPTLCDLAGVPRPASAEGRSLLGLIQGRQTSLRDELFFAYRMDQRSVRESRWKLIDYPRMGIRQLFDLQRDPEELNNLADNPRHRPQLDRLLGRLHSLQEELGDPLGAPPKVVTSTRTDRGSTRRTATPADEKPDPALAPIVDQPGLPRVLLIGDSISIGYTLPTRRQLADVANVHRIPVNAGSTTNGLAHLDAWLGTNRWDVIHFNWGLHDLKLNPDGSNWVPLSQYTANLERLVTRLRRTGARLIWASTTPVPEGKLNPPRRPGDVLLYNRAADELMRRTGVAINDLYAGTVGDLQTFQRPANVHFQPEGSEALARQVAARIREALR